MTHSPEEELAEFLASKPKWVQTALQEDASKLTLKQSKEWDELRAVLTDQYVQILRRIPAKWKQYRKKILREYGNTFASLLLPEGKPGRPRDDKAEEFEALHSSGKSYREIAESELFAEPDSEVKQRRVETERERIRQAVGRSRRRKRTPPDPVQN